VNDYFTLRQECPCCGSRNAHELCRTPYSTDPMREYLVSFYSPQGRVEFEYLQDQDYVLFECVDCDLIYQPEIPNDLLMHKLYEEWIDPKKCFDLHERPRRIQYFSHLSSEIVAIISLLDRPPIELEFLDFGMGWGHWCRLALSFGCTVQGTEFSRSRADYARSKGVQVIDHSEIGSHRYDFINTEQVFEHLPEIRSTLEYLKGSLKPGGILKISVPNGRNIKARLKTWNWTAPKGSRDSLNPVAPLEHLNCFNHSSLILFATNSGLVPVDTTRGPSEGGGPRNVRQAGKAILRPFWHWMKGLWRPRVSKGTRILFRASDAA
jgi:SAM-dependent methyltransferase